MSVLNSFELIRTTLNGQTLGPETGGDTFTKVRVKKRTTKKIKRDSRMRFIWSLLAIIGLIAARRGVAF